MAIDREQKLVDIAYEVAMTIKDNSDYWKGKTSEEIATWVSRQLRQCGFDTQPVGSSWGKLK